MSKASRQAYALAYPLNRADIDQGQIAALRSVDPLPGGNLLCSILAVDR